MEPPVREWSGMGRREVLLMWILPAIGAAVLSLLLSGGRQQLAVVAFIVSFICAYASFVVGVFPLLWLSKQLNWRSWYHYAGSGFLGVLFPWLVVALIYRAFRGSLAPSGSFQEVGLTVSSYAEFLWLPSVIGAIGATVFWLLCVRSSPSRRGI